MDSGFLRTGAPRWVVTVGVILLTIVLRVGVESSTALSRGEEAQAAGDLDAAVFHYRSAAQWYAPGAPWPRAALENLLEVASLSEKACEDCPRPCDAEGVSGCETPACSACVFAVHVHDSARAGILGARSFYTPHSDLLEQVNARFPGVLARAREVHPNGPRSTPDQRAEWTRKFAERMAVDHAPDPLLASISSLAFLAWIIAMCMAIWRGWPQAGRLNSSALVRWGGVSLVAFVTWAWTLASLG